MAWLTGKVQVFATKLKKTLQVGTPLAVFENNQWKNQEGIVIQSRTISSFDLAAQVRKYKFQKETK